MCRGLGSAILCRIVPLPGLVVVRNTFDGDVEVVAEGPRDKLETLLDYLRRGPRSAVVTQVDVEWSSASGEFRRFEIRPTV